MRKITIMSKNEPILVRSKCLRRLTHFVCHDECHELSFYQTFDIPLWSRDKQHFLCSILTYIWFRNELELCWQYNTTLTNKIIYIMYVLIIWLDKKKMMTIWQCSIIWCSFIYMTRLFFFVNKAKTSHCYCEMKVCSGIFITRVQFITRSISSYNWWFDLRTLWQRWKSFYVKCVNH